MKTSLNDIKTSEQYLNNLLTTGERLVFEARMLTDPSLRRNVFLQKKINTLIKFYYRIRLKEKVSAAHERLLHHPSNEVFKNEILELFKNRLR